MSKTSNKFFMKVDIMEVDIVHSEEPGYYTAEDFKELAEDITVLKDCAKSFEDYKEACFYLEKIEWLKVKHTNLILGKERDTIKQRLMESMSQQFRGDLLKLIDLLDVKSVE